MSSSPISVSHDVRWGGRLDPALATRIGLAALAVAFCYCFRWEFLRYLTSEANLRLDGLTGVFMTRISGDTVMWRGALYHYDIACTFADAWCGAIPLVWNLRRSMASNLALVAALAIALFFCNVVRLSISDVLFAAGVPWFWAHGFVGGLSYFAVWAWIRNRHAWSQAC